MRSTENEQWRAFGDVIKARRISRGYTLRSFAREIPIAPSYQCFIESGQVPPPSDTVLVRMAELLNVPAQTLFVQAGHLPPDMLLTFWQHPAIPPILSTIPGMSLETAQTFCRQVLDSLSQSPPA
jgi:HTH-type transcriptional regulator, competence development regulator